jgi:hypothetical protein
MDPDPSQLELFKEVAKDVKPIDVSADLPRHATKKHKTRALSGIKRIVVHTTDWVVTPKDLAEYDIGPNHISDTGCPGITYHEMITESGILFKTLPWEEVSWHAGIWNPGSLAIALVYKVSNSEGVDTYAPFPQALQTLQTRAGDIFLELGLTPDKLVGHRELKGTGWFWSKGSKRLRKTCPGLKVDMDLLRANCAKYMQILLKCAHHYDGKIDGDFGPKSRAALEAHVQTR